MIELIVRAIVPTALTLLPPSMDSRAARAMLIAIGLQESRFQHRRQVNFGPARGFWQFEKAGVRGVMRHIDTRGHLEAALRELRYESIIGKTAELHYTIEDNDVLAAVFARLLLWTVPGRLPQITEHDRAWEQYIEGWRPGKPHRNTWRALYDEAWQRVSIGEPT